MKRFQIAGMLVGSAVVAMLVMHAAGVAAEKSLADFKIVVSVDPEKNGVILKCIEGCAWTDLSFACPEGEACSSPVDKYGMAEVRIDVDADFIARVQRLARAAVAADVHNGNIS